MEHRRFLPAGGCTVLAVLLLTCCSNGDEETAEKPNPQWAQARAGVARISIDGGGLELRKLGETEFTPIKGYAVLEKGSTLKTTLGVAALNFMGCVTLKMGADTVLILEGECKGKKGKEYVLGLKQGELEINSSADHPVLVKMPHGEVRSLRAYLKISELERKETGYTASVLALTSNPVTVANRFEAIIAPPFSVVRVDETEPPVVLKKDPRRK